MGTLAIGGQVTAKGANAPPPPPKKLPLLLSFFPELNFSNPPPFLFLLVCLSLLHLNHSVLLSWLWTYVLRNFCLLFRTFTFLFETYAAFPCLFHPLFSSRYDHIQVKTMLYQTVWTHELFMNTHNLCLLIYCMNVFWCANIELFWEHANNP